MPKAFQPVRWTLLAILFFAAALGQEEGQEPPQTPAELPAPPVETQHSVALAGGRTLQYTATTGLMPMQDEQGKLKATIFFVAYTLNGVQDASERPLTFCFNGGPGSSSVWLHLGAIGPRRALMSDEGELLPPPYRLVENEHSWLGFSDLVFIDPVLTGYSRPAEGEEKEQFHGVEEDVQSVGDFIRLYTTRYKRWTSPKFIAGESYGTTRAAGLSGYLQQRHGMYLSGLMLISSILNFQTADFNVGNDLPYILYLPTYTAAAWYHGKLKADFDSLEDALDASRRFALNDYVLALLQGTNLPEGERRRIVERLSALTGLSEEYVQSAHMRIEHVRFAKQLLRDEGKTIGRLDARFTGMDRDSAGEGFEFDPSYAAIQGPYTALLNSYLREQLGYENDLPYEILGPRVQPWNWGSAREGYVNVAETLRSAMHQNPHLHVLVANGYYDMATPFFATEYTFTHLGGDPALPERVRLTYYPAGHMMYIRKASLEQLRKDAGQFVDWALAAGR